MNPIVKTAVRLVSLTTLTALVFAGGVVTRFNQNNQKTASRGGLNPFSPEFAHAEFSPPTGGGGGEGSGGEGGGGSCEGTSGGGGGGDC